MKGKVRHEYKYPITFGQLEIEQAKLSAIAGKDGHVGEQGYYNIRSLYFDDYYNSCLNENIAGTDEREKYRIRIYNGSYERISLEIKGKSHGKTFKTSCMISKEQCESLMKGEIPDCIEDNQTELRRLVNLIYTRLMKPAIIVDYDRIPYIYRLEDTNVRITFDYNITSCSDVGSFLDKNVYGRSVLPLGQALMEVKFDTFLPDEIYNVLSLDNLSASTFSKYYLCRKFKG